MSHSPDPGFPEFRVSPEELLEIEEFRQLDYEAIKKYNIPLELMMENAGLHLARIIAVHTNKESNILVLAGKGNNGGGGLTAARRLACWGYKVSMYMPDLPGSSLVETQKVRAINCGVTETDPLGTEKIMRTELMKAEVMVDALLGFSQRLPLPGSYMEILRYATGWDGLKISLDMPTGIISDELSERFPADIICTLAAPKKILFQKAANSIIYLADLGIPKEIYAQKGIVFKIPFEKSSVFTLRTS